MLQVIKIITTIFFCIILHSQVYALFSEITYSYLFNCPSQPCEYNKPCKCLNQVFKKINGGFWWNSDDIYNAENNRKGCMLKNEVYKGTSAQNLSCIDNLDLNNGVNLRSSLAYSTGFTGVFLVENYKLTHGQCVLVKYNKYKAYGLEFFNYKRYCARIVKYNSKNYNVEYPDFTYNEEGNKVKDPNYKNYKMDKLCVYNDPFYYEDKKPFDFNAYYENKDDKLDTNPYYQQYHLNQLVNGTKPNKVVESLIGCVQINLSPSLPRYSPNSYPAIVTSIAVEAICPKNRNSINNKMPCQSQINDFNKTYNSFIKNSIRLSYSWRIPACDVVKSDSCVEIENIKNIEDFIIKQQQTKLSFNGRNNNPYIKQASKNNIETICKKIRNKATCDGDFRIVFADKIGKEFQNFRYTKELDGQLGNFYGIDIGEYQDYIFDAKNDLKLNKNTKEEIFNIRNKPTKIKLTLEANKLCASYAANDNLIDCVPRHYTDNNYELKLIPNKDNNNPQNIKDINHLDPKFEVSLSSLGDSITVNNIGILTFINMQNAQQSSSKFEIAKMPYQINILDEDGKKRLEEQKSTNINKDTKYNNCKYRSSDKDSINQVLFDLLDENNILNFTCGDYAEQFQIIQTASNDQDNKDIKKQFEQIMKDFETQAQNNDKITDNNLYKKIIDQDNVYLEKIELFGNYYIRGGKYAYLITDIDGKVTESDKQLPELKQQEVKDQKDYCNLVEISPIKWNKTKFKESKLGECLPEHVLVFNNKEDIESFLKYCNRTCGIGKMPENNFEFSWRNYAKELCAFKCQKIKLENIVDENESNQNNIIRNITIRGKKTDNILNPKKEEEKSTQINKIKIKLQKNQGEILIQIVNQALYANDNIEFELNASRVHLFFVSDNLTVEMQNQDNVYQKIEKTNIIKIDKDSLYDKIENYCKAKNNCKTNPEYIKFKLILQNKIESNTPIKLKVIYKK